MRKLMLWNAVAVLFFSLPTYGAGKRPGPCAEDIFLAERQFQEIKKIAGDHNKFIQFTFSKTNREYFRQNRENLRFLVGELDRKYINMRHAWWPLLIANMFGAHAYMQGEPGGAKSKISSLIQTTPVVRPNGVVGPDNFELQFNQMVSDILIRGYVDPRTLTPGQAPTITDIRDDGTLVRFLRGRLEEVEKGNPLVFAAVLDVLNLDERVARHGGIQREARTRTVVSLSNVTLYMFLKIFRDLGMESTGRAFLDRMGYKIYVPDFIPDDQLGAEVLEIGAENSVDKAFAEMQDPRALFIEKAISCQDTCNHPILGKKEVNFLWLGHLSKAARVVDPTFFPAMRKIFKDLRLGYRQVRRDSEKEIRTGKVDPQTPAYFPPSSASVRTQMVYGYQAVAASMMLQLLLMDPKIMPDDRIERLLEGGELTLSALSLWRLHEAHTTNAPGAPILIAEKAKSAGGGRIQLDFRSQLEDLKGYALGTEEEVMITYYGKEQDIFGRSYNNLLEGRSDTAKSIAEGLRQADSPGRARRGARTQIELEGLFVSP